MRVENELMTKVEKMPCSTQCSHNTFTQERMRGRLMSEGTRSSKAEVELVGSDRIVRFDAILNCVVVLGREKKGVRCDIHVVRYPLTGA